MRAAGIIAMCNPYASESVQPAPDPGCLLNCATHGVSLGYAQRWDQLVDPARIVVLIALGLLLHSEQMTCWIQSHPALHSFLW